jgi:hypothetical protein
VRHMLLKILKSFVTSQWSRSVNPLKGAEGAGLCLSPLRSLVM